MRQKVKGSPIEPLEIFPAFRVWNAYHRKVPLLRQFDGLVEDLSRIALDPVKQSKFQLKILFSELSAIRSELAGLGELN